MVYSRETEVSSWPVVLKSHNKCTNERASSIVFGCISPYFSKGSTYQNIFMIYDLHSYLYISYDLHGLTLTCISVTNCNLL